MKTRKRDRKRIGKEADSDLAFFKIALAKDKSENEEKSRVSEKEDRSQESSKRDQPQHNAEAHIDESPEFAEIRKNLSSEQIIEKMQEDRKMA